MKMHLSFVMNHENFKNNSNLINKLIFCNFDIVFYQYLQNMKKKYSCDHFEENSEYLKSLPFFDVGCIKNPSVRSLNIFWSYSISIQHNITYNAASILFTSFFSKQTQKKYPHFKFNILINAIEDTWDRFNEFFTFFK